MAMQPKKAIRDRVFMKAVVTGASGAGKSLGAIAIAVGMASTGKVLVVDTENRSASYYASRWDFDVIEMEAPFTTQKYNEALKCAVDNGYEVVVIDSLTHEWAGSGGLQDQKSQKDARGGSSFANWSEMKMMHNKFVENLLQSRIHVIGTLRSKMSYVLEENDKGRATPRKVGLAPISADDMEYEFGIVFDVDRNSHLAVASKDRTGLFEARTLNLDESVGREIAGWLAGGSSPAPAFLERAPQISEKETQAQLGQMVQDKKEENLHKPVDASSASFADSITPLPRITMSQWEDLNDLQTAAGIDGRQLRPYCVKKGWLPANAEGLDRLSPDGFKPLQLNLGPEKSRAFKAWLETNFPLPITPTKTKRSKSAA